MLKLGKGKNIRLSKWTRPDVHLLDISSKKVTTCGINDKVRDVLEVFAQRYRRLPVLDERGHVRGMVAATDILEVLGGWGKYKRSSPKKRLDVKVKDVMSRHVLHLDKNTELAAVLSFFKKHRLGSYPVLYRKKLLGIVTEWDLVRQVRGKTGVKVHEIMIRKPLVAQVRYSVFDVAKMFCMGGFRRLPVMRKGLLMGMVTPRDILRFLYVKKIPDKLQEQDQSVKGVMENRVIAIRPGEDVHEAAKAMLSKKIGGIPVVDEGELVGIITERDIVDVAEF